MISYLLESSLCLAAFYLLYRLSFSKMKLLNVNRFYLVVSAVISLLIPLLEIPLSSEVSLITLSRDGTTPTEGIVTAMASNTAGYKVNPWIAIYLFGFLISFVFLLRSSLHIVHLLRCPREKAGRFWHVYTNQSEISSFYRFIFLPADFDEHTEEARLALAHEEVHLRHYHSIDLIFFQLLSLFFWFNPFAHAYKRSLKLQHEYIADDLVAQRTSRSVYSNTLIKHVLKGVNASLIHSYAEHPVEKRLEMIENPNPTIMKKLRLFFSLPLLAIMVFTFGFTTTGTAQDTVEKLKSSIVDTMDKQTDPEKPKQIKGRVQAGKTGSPLKGVSVIRMPTRTSGTVTNAEGDYLVVLAESDTSLIFRKKGYQDMNVSRKNFSVINVALLEVKKKKDGN